MTSAPHSPGAATSSRSTSAIPTSTSSGKGRQPSALPHSSISRTENPRGEGASSLYALAIQAQDIAGEIALAAELLDGDPEHEETAIALIETYLEAQGHTMALIESKADNICRYVDHLSAVAQFRKEQAKRLAELAAEDERRAQQLTDYMLKVLTTLYPEQVKFSLPTHELRSRKSEAVEIDDEDLIPDDMFREKVTRSPDKTAIKAALKAGQEIVGARLVSRTNWSIK
jgi:hypothetical protein